jgi:hypothetical protein
VWSVSGSVSATVSGSVSAAVSGNVSATVSGSVRASVGQCQSYKRWLICVDTGDDNNDANVVSEWW